VRHIPRSEIEARLSDANLEMTPQRFAVLEYLARSETEPTVDEVFQNLKRLYARPSRESIEKTLTTLCESGIVCTEMSAEKSIRYRLRFDPLQPLPSSYLEDD
jgi:Fur family transcriptional regulator, peroxide stress response regulator